MHLNGRPTSRNMVYEPQFGMDFQREKRINDRCIWRFSYFINKVLVITLGKTKTTKLLLGTSWVAGRIAFESSGEVFGQDFHNSALATNPITLAAVIPVNSRVIDIGCGTGRWSRVVADLGCQVLGVDYSTQNIQTARALGGNIEYLEFDVTKKIEMC